MTKQKNNNITSSTFPNSNPRLSRSTLMHCTISNLGAGDIISRCHIDYATISKTSSGPANGDKQEQEPKRLALKRSNISTSTLVNTSLNKTDILRSTLSNVPLARLLEAKSSTIENASRLRRVSVANTVITDQSAIARSEAKESVATASTLSRASLEKSRVVGSRVIRSTLKDCEVTNCEIVNTDFCGMVLRNGIWKNGRLVGCFSKDSEEEGVVINGKVCFIVSEEIYRPVLMLVAYDCTAAE